MQHIMKFPIAFALFGIMLMSTIGCTAQERSVPTGTVHQFNVKTIEGTEKSL